MKIELKSVKINNAFSEETICFKADVFVNGVKTAYASNDGRGGCTFYNSYEGKRELLKEAEAYAISLPSEYYDFGDTKMEIKSNLEGIIDTMIGDILSEKENAKHEKKVAKLMVNHIVYGVPNGNSYATISFKGKPKFDEMIKTPQGKQAVINLYNRIKSELKKGKKILNTNIEVFKL